jgi:hypothetical protein
MVFALVHRYLNVQFPVDIFLYMTCQLEMSLYVVFQRCNLHLVFLVFQLTEHLSPYPLYVVASDIQNLNSQI